MLPDAFCASRTCLEAMTKKIESATTPVRNDDDRMFTVPSLELSSIGAFRRNPLFFGSGNIVMGPIPAPI
jgi:hypothetical protein